MSDQVIRIFESLPDLAARNPALVRRARNARAVLLLEAGAGRARLRLRGGTFAILPADVPMGGWDTALRAEPDAWLDHWQPLPAPDSFDIFGMARRGRMRIEGNFMPLMQHLQVIKDILSLPRGQS